MHYGALKDVTMIVAYSSERYPTPPGRLADTWRILLKFFKTGTGLAPFPLPGFPLAGLTLPRRSVARCLRPDPPAAIQPPAAPPRTDPGQRPGRRAQHSAQRRAETGAVPRGCVVPVLRPITQRQHTSACAANATSSPTSAIGTARHDASGPPAPLPTRHAQSSSLLPAWLRHPVSPAAQPASKLEGTST